MTLQRNPSISDRLSRALQGGLVMYVSCALCEPAVAEPDVTEPPSQAIPEVLVEGSQLLDTDVRRTPDDAQPYVVFDRAAIERSADSNIEDFLRDHLTMGVSPSIQSQGPSGGGSTSSINLRGLGTNQTLILIDGRRGAPLDISGIPQQPDLNGIPLAAIERIEILPTTASGIYGGSATGGVVNVVLRRDYQGVEAQLTYGNSFEGDAGNRRVDLTSGLTLEGGRTHLLMAASYAWADPLQAGDRDFVQQGRATILANNRGYYYNAAVPPLGATTNIRSVSGDLTLKGTNQSLGSAITFVPRGYAGVSSDGGSALVADAGKYNLDLADTAQSGGGSGVALLNNPSVESLMMTARREFSEHVQGFLDLGVMSNFGHAWTNTANSSFTLPSSSPANPFNQDIRITTPALGANGEMNTDSTDRRVVGGVIVRLPADWNADAEYLWEQSRFSSIIPGGLAVSPTTFVPLAQTALNARTINVLRDTNMYPVDFSAFMGQPTVFTPVDTTLKSATLRLAGRVGSLPGGPPTVSILLEHRDELYDNAYFETQGASFLYPSRSQTVNSEYLEMLLPLVSTRNRLPGIELIELQLAGRHDDYIVGGSSSSINLLAAPTPVVRVRDRRDSTNPTIGLRYQPVHYVIFRSSYATGYLPPGVNQLVPGPTTVLSTSVLATLHDPLRGNEPLGLHGNVQSASGGNPQLSAEQSESWSTGLILTPQCLADTRLSVDWTRIRKKDNITSLPINQQAIDSEPYVPGLIVRGAPSRDGYAVGPIIGVNGGLINIARLQTDALDLSLDTRRDLGRPGELSLLLSGTHLLHFTTQLNALAPMVEAAGVTPQFTGQGGLSWQANSTLSWSVRHLDLAWSTRFFDGYWLNAGHTVLVNQGSARVPSQIYHDLMAIYHFVGDAKFSVLSGVELRVAATNVLNKRPPIDVSGPLGDLYSHWGDPRLASYSISIRKPF